MQQSKADHIRTGPYKHAQLLGQHRDGDDLYWYVPEGDVVIKHIGDEGEFDDESAFELVDMGDDETVEEYLNGNDDFSRVTETDLGHWLRYAAPFNGVHVLSDRRTKVWAISEFTHLPRKTAAEYLGISPNTFDDHRQIARKRVNHAMGIGEAAYGKED